MLDVPATLLTAIRHQQATRYAEAETLYRAVLADDPDDPYATYLYGLLQLGTGRTAAAVGSLGRAASLRPSHLATRLGLGRALLADKQSGEALAAADAVLAQEPGSAQALFLRGTALSTLGRPADAVAVLHRAIAADPTNAAAHLNLGNALADLDELAAGYRGFIARWADGRVAPRLAAEPLAAELLLVHDWLELLRRDPRLPRRCLPVDWPAAPAQAVFRRARGSHATEAELIAARLLAIGSSSAA